MRSIYLYILLEILLLSIQTDAQTTFLDNPVLRPLFRRIRNLMSNFYSSDGSMEDILRINEKMNKLQKQFNASMPFFCDTKNGPGARSKQIPKDVHHLRPGDIDIIGAIGDSLTAANGVLATNLLQVTLEYRGISFSIGGYSNWRQFLTLPNILKEYNNKLYGYSLDTGLSTHKNSKFNVAELGAMSRDIVHMAKTLVQRILSDPNVKPYHWKLITMLIGANDFCLDICYHKNPHEIVKMHERDLVSALRIIRDNLPRTLFQVVLPPNMRVLINLKGKKPECEATHRFECPCFFGSQHRKNQNLYLKIIDEWVEKVIEVCNRNEFNSKEFTVNVQPFTRNVIFPTLPHTSLHDFTYLSEDCFHLSQKANSLAAQALWNNMFEKNGNKSDNWDYERPFEKFLCPTEENPFIATRYI